MVDPAGLFRLNTCASASNDLQGLLGWLSNFKLGLDGFAMFAADDIPIQRRGFQLEELDGETLLYRHSLKKLIYLNESAASIWRLCDGKRTAREIANLLTDVYPEAGDIVAAEVADAIDSLVREGALRMAHRPDELEPDAVGNSAGSQAASGKLA